MTKSVIRRTVNVGDVEIFVEIYNRAEMEADKTALSIGDMAWETDQDGNTVELVWYGIEEQWVAQPLVTTVSGMVGNTAVAPVDRMNSVLRIMNNIPGFDAAEYRNSHIEVAEVKQ